MTPEEKLKEEIQAHLDLLAEQHERRGLSREEARLAARRDFGGVEQMKETYRDQRGFRWIDSCARDVRYVPTTTSGRYLHHEMATRRKENFGELRRQRATDRAQSVASTVSGWSDLVDASC